MKFPQHNNYLSFNNHINSSCPCLVQASFFILSTARVLIIATIITPDKVLSRQQSDKSHLTTIHEPHALLHVLCLYVSNCQSSRQYSLLRTSCDDSRCCDDMNGEGRPARRKGAEQEGGRDGEVLGKVGRRVDIVWLAKSATQGDWHFLQLPSLWAASQAVERSLR